MDAGEDEEGRQTPDWTRQHREDKARKEAEEQAVIAAKKNAADKAKFDAMPTWRQKLVEKTRVRPCAGSPRTGVLA